MFLQQYKNDVSNRLIKYKSSHKLVLLLSCHSVKKYCLLQYGQVEKISFILFVMLQLHCPQPSISKHWPARLSINTVSTLKGQLSVKTRPRCHLIKLSGF